MVRAWTQLGHMHGLYAAKHHVVEVTPSLAGTAAYQRMSDAVLMKLIEGGAG